jgi:asparagine synthase (glutamine-hydrolysing)
MLYTDIKTWMVDDLLMKADKMTMANSLEVRVPFLDHELVEFAFNFDSNWKIKNNISKFILKKSFENNLPKDLVYRKKMGFPVPWAEWIKNKKSDYVDGILFNTNSNIRDYLDINEIKKIFKLHRTTNIDYCQSIGALLMLEHWLILNKKKVV